MVHVAREAVWLTPTPGHGPGGYGNGFSVDVIDSSANGGFTAAPDAFAVHRVVSALSTVKASLPAGVVGRCDPLRMHASAMPPVAPLITINRSKLVMGSAIDGKRPDWLPAPEIVVERGEVIYERDRQGRIRRDAAGRPKVSMYLVRFVGDMPWDVARARLIYQVWTATLAWLRSELEGKLEGYALTELMPDAAPWT